VPIQEDEEADDDAHETRQGCNDSAHCLNIVHLRLFGISPAKLNRCNVSNLETLLQKSLSAWLLQGRDRRSGHPQQQAQGPDRARLGNQARTGMSRSCCFRNSTNTTWFNGMGIQADKKIAS